MPHDDLQAQIDDLRRQLGALTQSIELRPARKTWVPLISLGAFLLGGFAFAPILHERRALAVQDEKDVKEKELVCSSLKVVNREGRTLVDLHADPDGGFIKVNGQDGKQRMFIGVSDKSGGGVIGLRDPAEIYRSVWEVNTKGTPSFTTRNAAGRTEMYLGSAEAGSGGILNLNDAQGRNVVMMNVAAPGRGYLGMYNQANQPEVVLGSSADKWGGVLNLNAPHGRSGVILDVNERAEGRLNLYDKMDKVLFFVGGDGKGGFLKIGDHDGKDLLRMGLADKTTGAYVELRDGATNQTRLNVGTLEGILRRLNERVP